MNSSRALVCNCSRFSSLKCTRPVISRGMKQLRMDDMYYKPGSYRERVYQQTWAEQYMTEEPQEEPSCRREDSGSERSQSQRSQNRSGRRTDREYAQKTRQEHTYRMEEDDMSRWDDNRSPSSTGPSSSQSTRRGFQYATSASKGISDGAGTGDSTDSSTANAMIMKPVGPRRLQKITIPASEFISKFLSDQRKNKMRHYEAEVFSDRIGQEGFYLV